MKYEKPELEELELILEGSFLDNATGGTKPDPTNPDIGVEGGEGGDGEGDGYWN